MTTYSGVIGKNELAATSENSRFYYRANLVLLAIAILSLAAYIFLANFLVAQRYSLNLRRGEANALSAPAVSQNKHRADLNLETLMLFAQKSGMIEARDTESILQERSFALTQPNY